MAEQIGDATIYTGDVLDVLRSMPDESVHCVVTSPPYWGLRDYGIDGQIGLEKTPEEYIARMVEVFREARRVLRADGTVWVNIGDSYAGSGKGPSNSLQSEASCIGSHRGMNPLEGTPTAWLPVPAGLKPKDLVGIPWRVAFALQADGWYLRSDIIWHKPNPMPESVTDRPTKAHEYIFLLSKSARYFYDAEAVREAGESGPSDLRKMEEGLERIGGKHKDLQDPLSAASATTNIGRLRAVGGPGRKSGNKQRTPGSDVIPGASHVGRGFPWEGNSRNRRTVWTIATAPYKGAHFATFPPDLVKPCILAGCPAGGTVLDPFGGSGTTAAVALEYGRKAILIDLKPEYIAMAKERLRPVAGRPLLAFGAPHGA